MSVETLNYFLALGTLLLQIVTFVLLVSYFSPALVPASSQINEWLGKRGLLIAFVATLGGLLMTLFYSDVLGFEPCPLCWWQRIFLYPQVILFGYVLCRRGLHKRAAVDFSIALSILGAGVALYQHALQMFGEGSLPCPATGVSCAQRILFEFGYITFPLMAFSLFAFLIVVMLFVRKRA